MANKKNRATQRRKQETSFTSKIIGEFKDRQRAEIRKWRQAIDMATDPSSPRPYELQDLYDNLRSDGHFIGDVRVRKASTLCSSFSIIDGKTKVIQEEKTEMFKSKWFYDFMKNALDNTTLGYTLLELVDTQNIKFKVLPRRNIISLKRQIVASVQDDKGFAYDTELGRTIIELGEEQELGIMSDICGQLIWKRNAQQSWAEFSERFGFPLITATTNKSNPKEIKAIQNMLAALGEGATAALPEGTTIDIKEFTSGDAYQVYFKQIECINKEISKALLSSTMVTDDGSSRSQSEVHERTLNDKIAADDRRTIEFTVNEQLIPMLSLWGHDINPETDLFQFNPADELALDKYYDMVDKMLNHFDVDEEWIAGKFNVPVKAKQTTPVIATQSDTTDKTPKALGKALDDTHNKGGFASNFL